MSAGESPAMAAPVDDRETTIQPVPLTSRQANYALGVFLLAYILSFVDRQILSLMVDPIRRDLGIDDVQMGLLQGLAFALLYAFIGVPIGLLADRVRRTRIIAIGVLFWSACTALCGMASTYLMLFAARMGVGLGEATLSPAAHSFLSDAYPRARLARAMAIYTLGITIGGGMALMIGGSVIDMIASSGSITAPLFGTLRSWQAAFLVVSIPGVIVAMMVIVIKEPRRARDPRVAMPGFLTLLRYLACHWRAFVPIYFSSAVFAIMGYGLTAWYPTLLIRDFGFTQGEAGRYLGAMFLVLGSAGSISGGYVAEQLALRGRNDANLLTVGLVALAVCLPATFAPIMPSAFWVLLCFAPACFIFNAYFGCSVAAIQLATPREMRATNAALFLLANSLIGLSLGTTAVPLLDRYWFGATGHIGPALATVALLATVTAAALAFSGLRAYGKLVSSTSSNPV